ncbi:MAG TPA: nucleotidyltransferase domain-containing protein [Bryobacteraceae bacterium]
MARKRWTGARPDPSKSRGARLAAAQKAALTLASRQDIQLILLTGSLARGIESEDSDIDIAVFTDGDTDTFIRTFLVDDIPVEINTYLLDRLAKGPATPLLTLQDLREAGRFSTGQILHSCWKYLDQARSSWLKALLNPDAASELLALASNYLSQTQLEAVDSFADRVYCLQGAAAGLAVYALSLTAPRFQKPKWVIHDLRETGSVQLLRCIRSLYIGTTMNESRVELHLESIEKQLLAGLELGGLPPLIMTDSMSDEYFYIYRTFRDAISLNNDGDFEGCAYTSMYALRLLNALLQGDTGTKTVAEKEVNSWRREALAVLVPVIGLKESNLEAAREQLIECGMMLEREYRRRFLESQPFEWFEEGSWRNSRTSQCSSLSDSFVSHP